MKRRTDQRNDLLCRDKRGPLFLFLLYLILMVTACSQQGKEAFSAAASFVYGRERENTKTQNLTEGNHIEGKIAEVDGKVLIEDTEIPEEIEEELRSVSYIISFAGDCTLADLTMRREDGRSGTFKTFSGVVGEDYGWPFRNVLSYFENDDLTFVNFEGVLGFEGWPLDKMFLFRGSEEYVNCLTLGSIEMVTLANNHCYDFDYPGYDYSVQCLENAGVTYVEENNISLYVLREGTEEELRIGFYAASWPSLAQVRAGMEKLHELEPDLIVCAFHWGDEDVYHPYTPQIEVGHLAIDLGASIVYGSHAHVLQPVEEYGDGIIYYGMGNFCFGGNDHPLDYDSAILQQEIIREADGEVHLGKLMVIPCSISSEEKVNNCQPTPYEEGTDEYERTLEKLNGTYDGYIGEVHYY